jgi:hypothetical protein
LRADADKQILIKNEERLDGANISIRVLDDKIPVIKSLQNRIFDDLIVAMILSVTLESTCPTATPHQLVT